MDNLDASDDKDPVLRIEGEMTIYRVGELKGTLLAAIGKSSTLEIDLSAVTEIDTAGIQLLMLARKVAEAKGYALRLAAHSAAVVEAFELLNLAGYFGDPIVIVPAA
ncbi:STAS domain-containing protein [Noviherbaspirillum autotrophicum]|uniref:STAS domain-containing protein n=1 Tax=Noviherbaspirillum autotrophicum TaxID=709839 RepID=UPI0006942BC3|nr:STAS domain-containing protein [Noviherbaspirillum autotrophicum]